MEEHGDGRRFCQGWHAGELLFIVVVVVVVVVVVGSTCSSSTRCQTVKTENTKGTKNDRT